MTTGSLNSGRGSLISKAPILIDSSSNLPHTIKIAILIDNFNSRAKLSQERAPVLESDADLSYKNLSGVSSNKSYVLISERFSKKES